MCYNFSYKMNLQQAIPEQSMPLLTSSMRHPKIFFKNIHQKN